MRQPGVGKAYQITAGKVQKAVHQKAMEAAVHQKAVKAAVHQKAATEGLARKPKSLL